MRPTTPAREEAFAQIQQIGAEDAPTIPYIELNQVAVSREGVEGVEETLDPSYIFRYWLISTELGRNDGSIGRWRASARGGRCDVAG